MHYMYVSHVLYVCITAKGSRTGAVLEPFLVSDYDVLIDRAFRASLRCHDMNKCNKRTSTKSADTSHESLRFSAAIRGWTSKKDGKWIK